MRTLPPGRSLCSSGALATVVLVAAIVACCAADGAENARGATRCLPREHFVETEIAVDDERTLGRLLSYRRAPGSQARVLRKGTHVCLELPAPIVANLIEEGAEVRVLREFMLVEKPGHRARSVRKSLVAPAADCSGPHETGSSDTEHAIPEGDWTHSDIAIDAAPADAVVTCIDMHYEIVHTYASDLLVNLTNQNQTIEYRLWEYEGGAAANVNETVTGIMDFAGESANQVWQLWATDAYPADTGFIDSWWIKVYYEIPTNAPAHDELSHPAIVQSGVPYTGTTVGATGQYESTCGYQDVLDVWHLYIPERSGLVSIRTESDTFDTTLNVFDVYGTEGACGDDDCEGTNSIVTMPMTAGVGCFIRVAGYDHETGDYTLTVNEHPAVLPDVPSQPTPADGSGVGSLPIVLSWSGTAPTANSPGEDKTRLKSGGGDVSQPKTIYGRDDRVEEYQITDPNVLAVGEATAMILYRLDLVDNEDGTYEVQAPSFAGWYEWLDPLETGHALCDDEPFREQPSAGICSATLVGADLVATAGHCVACLHPDDIAVVFDFVMQDANTATTTLRADQVYWPTEIVAYQTGYPDWGLVSLDRAVVGRRPLSLRRDKQVADDQRLLVVGHPWGLPKKYDAGAVVTENTEPAFFQANVDTYQGSSGSPVVNLDSWVVEGLLVRGMEDFVEDETLGCDRSLVCPDTGCPDGDRFEWQDVSRATTFSAAVPSFDVYLGTDPDHLELAGAGLVVPRYDPGPLRKDAVYYWRVIARNVHGQTEGPLWSFRTASSPVVEQGNGEMF